MHADDRPEPAYDVVWPLSPIRMSDSLADRPERGTKVEGQKIGLIWDYIHQGEVILEQVRDALLETHDDLEFVDYSVYGDIHGHNDVEVLGELPELLLATEVDSVIVAVGA